MGKTLNRIEVAEFFGFSAPTVDAWVREGCPVQGGGGRGIPYAFDSAEVHRWLLGRTKKVGRPSSKPDDERSGDPDFVSTDEAIRRKAVADAKKAEIGLAKEMNLVAPIDTIAKVVSNEIANARARLLGVPTKLRPTAQTLATDEAASKTIVNTVEELIRDALTEIKAYGEPAP